MLIFILGGRLCGILLYYVFFRIKTNFQKLLMVILRVESERWLSVHHLTWGSSPSQAEICLRLISRPSLGWLVSFPLWPSPLVLSAHQSKTWTQTQAEPAIPAEPLHIRALPSTVSSSSGLNWGPSIKITLPLAMVVKNNSFIYSHIYEQIT